MVMSKINKRMIKNGILFKDLCTKEFCIIHDFMNHSVEVCFALCCLICLEEMKTWSEKLIAS